MAALIERKPPEQWMKFSVALGSKTIVVPCKETLVSVKSLIEEIERRATKQGLDKKVNVLHKVDAGVLDPDDDIRDVLDDNDHLVAVFDQVPVSAEVYRPVAFGGQATTAWEEHSDFLTKTEGDIDLKYRAHEQQHLSTLSLDANKVYLDGETLTPEALLALSDGKTLLDLSEEAWGRVARSRKMVDDIVAERRVVYGINTGFGNFATTVISHEKLEELQDNLIRSHAAGVGNPLPPQRVRMMMILRINVLAKGRSGVSRETLQGILDAFNNNCLPCIPEKGTVGASGDLAPLSHLALGLMGEGDMWSAATGWGSAGDILKKHNLKPLRLKAKEGLALINGTQLITALGSEACTRARNCLIQADIICALTVEALKGTTRAFDPDIHNARPHHGQKRVAARLRALLNSDRYPSEIALSHKDCDKVQDSYTLRCVPQVHGIALDTVDFVRSVLQTEMNSATDNPMVFAERNDIISGGNFHGEYPAKVLDYLAIGIHEVCNISERRIERMTNPALSGVPAFLVQEGGLNSGFMIAHCTAAALVSENKVLCHPSSIDSIPTSASKEDHVSMGGWSARKALRVVEHVETVLAIELLAAAQAIEFLRPLKTTAPLEAVHALLREKVAPWDKDRVMSPDIEATVRLIREGRVAEVVAPFMGNE